MMGIWRFLFPPLPPQATIWLRCFHGRALYCAIPKCASSSLTAMLLRAEGVRLPPGASPHAVAADALGLAALPRRVARALLSSPDVYRFGVMRDPIGRLASVYVGKVVMQTNPAVWARFGDTTFAAFVAYAGATNDEDLDPHLRPQAWYIGDLGWDIWPMQPMVPLVLALSERFATDITLPHLNATPRGGLGCDCSRMRPSEIRATGVMPIAADLYTPELRRAVLTRYSRDESLWTCAQSKTATSSAITRRRDDR